MTKEQMVAAVKECAEKLGRAPSQSEFRKATAMGKGHVRKHFGTFRQLLEASGLEARGSGHIVRIEDLFLDWAAIVRELKKTPTLADYELHSRYSPRWKSGPLGPRKGGLESFRASARWKSGPLGPRKERLESYRL